MPCNLVRGILVCSVHAFSAQSSPTSQTPSCSFDLDLVTTNSERCSERFARQCRILTVYQVCVSAGLVSARCRCKCVSVKAALSQEAPLGSVVLSCPVSVKGLDVAVRVLSEVFTCKPARE